MRRSRHLPLTLSVLLAASGAALPVAFGQSAEAESADTLAKEARVHYDQSRFDQAVSAYLRAYKLSPSAGFLYNVGVIYDRKLNEPELAIDFYRRYIRAEDADPSAVERATARLKTLKEAAAARVRPEPVPPPKVAPPAPGESAEALPPAEVPSTPRKLAAYALLGTGGAALVGGVALGLLAARGEEKYRDADSVDDKKSLQSLGRNEALAGDLLMGGGFVLAGVGAVLLLTGGASPRAAPTSTADAEPEVRLEPMPGGLGLWLRGAL